MGIKTETDRAEIGIKGRTTGAKDSQEFQKTGLTLRSKEICNSGFKFPWNGDSNSLNFPFETEMSPLLCPHIIFRI